MKKLLFILTISYLFASEIALPQFSIDDGGIYNIHSEQYISDRID